MTIEIQKDVISYVDSEALYKIISNLISNAIKFTKDKIKIKLSVNGNNYFLSVEDNGIGIKEAHLDKIFETFYQIQTTDNTMNKGSGLGLSLSKALAQKLGGDIFVQSNYSKGSIFTLALPIKSQETLPQEINESINDTDISELAETGQNILIVDDNSELRIFIKECLSDKYTVTEANNGIEALKIIENKNIDIIISWKIIITSDKSEPIWHNLQNSACNNATVQAVNIMDFFISGIRRHLFYCLTLFLFFFFLFFFIFL